MPKCGDDDDSERLGVGNISGCTRKGYIEDWQTPPKVLTHEEPWICPNSDPNNIGDDPSLRPWTVYYLSTLTLEKTIWLYNFLTVTLYKNPFYWGFIKGFTLFAFGIVTMFDISRRLQAACDKKKKCEELFKKYARD